MESAEVEGWKGGIITEFQNFGKRKVYKIVLRRSSQWKEDPKDEMGLPNEV